MTHDEALTQLREMLKPGDTVHTILRHVARSGMSRSISPVLVRDGEIHDISYLVGPACDYRFDRDHGGLKTSGAGMDMGFALVYNLSRTIFPGGHGCAGEGCPSNDHSNGDRDYTPHKIIPTVAHWHNDGGYALRQRWI